MFYLGFVGTVGYAVFIVIQTWINDEQFTLLSYSGRQYLLVLCGCMFDSLSMNCLIFAFQSSSSGFVSLFTYLTIVYSLLADKYIFDEIVTRREVTAAAVILFSTFIVSTYKIVFATKPS